MAKFFFPQTGENIEAKTLQEAQAKFAKKHAPAKAKKSSHPLKKSKQVKKVVKLHQSNPPSK